MVNAQEVWRKIAGRHYRLDGGEVVPLMLLGLKRDLRVEGPGLIDPQEVNGPTHERDAKKYGIEKLTPPPWRYRRDLGSLKKCIVIAMRNVRLLLANC